LGIPQRPLDQSEGRSADVPWRLIYIWICSGSAQCHRHRGFLTWYLATNSLNRVTVKGNMRRRISSVWSQCSICGRETEDEHHAIIRVVLLLWRALRHQNNVVRGDGKLSICC
jgi:hypothetical protein